MTGPTIFNNILWNCVAEGEGEYYMGLYSLNDRKPFFRDLVTLPKNHDLLQPYEGQRTTEILQWFTNEYYMVKKGENGAMELNDLRFGSVSVEDPENPVFVFKFNLEVKDGVLEATQERGAEEAGEEAFAVLWRRIKGQ